MQKKKKIADIPFAKDNKLFEALPIITIIMIKTAQE